MKVAGMTEKTNKARCVVNLEFYRRRVRTYIDLHSYSTAMFWADKVVSLSNEDPQDVYWLAQCMYLLKQYHRAAELIRSRGLDKRNTMCYYLAARCLLEANELQEALQVLNGIDSMHNNSQSVFLAETQKELQSAILLLKGRVYEEMDNRALAVSCYKEALIKDVHCFEAFEALTQHQMLPSWEEEQVLTSMPFAEQCPQPKEEKLVQQLYATRLKKYHSPQESPGWESMPEALSGNMDLAVCEAERRYYNCDYRECLRITEEILKKDPYHSACFPVHIACLVDLKKSNKLFYLAHRLVDLYPDNAISWFAVGCYYYLIGKSDPARRYLAKATTLDRLFGPAWLAYGHSFAAENEHDQAMAAYFKASQLMKGCHLPLLYIGLENGLTNNIRLADKFLKQAYEIAPADPFVLHEMGTVAFQNQDYVIAEQHFQEALQRVRSINGELFPGRWEPLFNNLGHTYRKLGKYDQALRMHQQALVLSPLNASTHAAMGYVHALTGDILEAVEMFHKALAIRRDDTFSTTMLGSLMQQLMDDTQPFSNGDAGEGEGADLPPMSLPSHTELNLDKNSGAQTAAPAPTTSADQQQQQQDPQAQQQELATNIVPRILLLDMSPSNMSFEVEMQDTSATNIE